MNLRWLYGISTAVPSGAFCNFQFHQYMSEVDTVAWSWTSFSCYQSNGAWLLNRILDDFFLEETEFTETIVSSYARDDEFQISKYELLMRLPHFQDVLLERNIGDSFLESLSFLGENICAICPTIADLD
eukprot:TRINITY_DN8223_c0_g1_i13.p1 TRINITY_DN8223_c0_g1~~TRINITY_DN8223_c0_g1_i13.p1  ORF type:complete len:129 (-),score=32.04 TRINITY_DN8223_c0_g1_i13:319-705(-)